MLKKFNEAVEDVLNAMNKAEVTYGEKEVASSKDKVKPLEKQYEDDYSSEKLNFTEKEKELFNKIPDALVKSDLVITDYKNKKEGFDIYKLNSKSGKKLYISLADEEAPTKNLQTKEFDGEEDLELLKKLLYHLTIQVK